MTLKGVIMYQFTKIPAEDYEFDRTEVTITLPGNDVDLAEVCDAFNNFLLACGFHFEGKHVDIIEDESSDEEPAIVDPPITDKDFIPVDNTQTLYLDE